MKVGLIGKGRWGQAYVRTFESAPHLGVLAGSATRDWEKLLDRSDIEAIIIATPPATHAEILEAAIARRLPVMVEKPLCLDLATAERLDEVVRSSGVPVLVNHIFLFHPGYIELKKKIAGEKIRMVFSEGGSDGPMRNDVSALWDWCPHDLSIAIDLFGAEPDEIGAVGLGNDLVALRLNFGTAHAWVHAGRLFPEKRRILAIDTDRNRHVLDDQKPQHLDETPLASAIRHFSEGIARPDAPWMGTGMALKVVRTLSRCDKILAAPQ